MDLFAATLAPELTSRKPKDPVKAMLMFVLSNAVALFAVYLSWNCSTQQGLGLAVKLAWALLAYCFGFFYVLVFAFRTRNACALML